LTQRARWPDELDPRLRRWLTRVQRVQAHLRSTLLIYAEKRSVGGDSMQATGWRQTVKGNDDYARRAAAADQTILYDALTLAVDEFAEVREQVQAAMDAAPPTTAPPGSRAKVVVMEARAKAGLSIFVDGDAR